jgi:putative transposase
MLMRIIDKQYLLTPFYGSRRFSEWLKRQGHNVNRKRVQHLMQKMGITAIYPRLQTSKREPNHKIYPYLLKALKIEEVNQVWSADITYIPMEKGFMYLVAIMDIYSRYLLSWSLSNSLETDFCLEALESSLSNDKPEIFNTDQGVQFTSHRFTEMLEVKEIKISMDGKGRYTDNIFIERLWRALKYEEIYLKNYENGIELYRSLKRYFDFYNHERPHQSLNYMTPSEVYFGQNK